MSCDDVRSTLHVAICDSQRLQMLKGLGAPPFTWQGPREAAESCNGSPQLQLL